VKTATRSTGIQAPKVTTHLVKRSCRHLNPIQEACMPSSLTLVLQGTCVIKKFSLSHSHQLNPEIGPYQVNILHVPLYCFL
jgi:hypothetical protein